MTNFEDFPLTSIQQEFFDLIDGTMDNYFINGKPGTGKSVLTRKLKNSEQSRKVWYTCAPTGLAALNAEGATLHRTFRLPSSEGIIPPNYNNFITDTRAINFIRYQIKHLLIDEISMVRADYLDFIDRQLQFIKRNTLPFGGVQVVVVGDFFQLPPVTKPGDKKALEEAGWETPFAFSSKVWNTFKVLTLNKVLRQKDDTFIDLLHVIRTGDVEPKHLVLINDLVEDDPEGTVLRLTGSNAQADNVNYGRLRAIPGEAVEFQAQIFGDWPEYPCDELLQLKVGAQVMVKRNAADRPPGHEGPFESDIVNGTVGIVKAINGPKPLLTLSDYDPDELEEKKEQIEQEAKEIAAWNKDPFNFTVTIETKNGDRTIYWQQWQRKIKQEITPGTWEEKVIASFEQLPITLAWAITMHKSQGQTFDKVHIDPSKLFTSGQFYVALSRCKTLQGVTMACRVDKKKIYADKDVVAYYKKIEPPARKKSFTKVAAELLDEDTPEVRERSPVKKVKRVIASNKLVVDRPEPTAKKKPSVKKVAKKTTSKNAKRKIRKQR